MILALLLLLSGPTGTLRFTVREPGEGRGAAVYQTTEGDVPTCAVAVPCNAPAGTVVESLCAVDDGEWAEGWGETTCAGPPTGVAEFIPAQR